MDDTLSPARRLRESQAVYLTDTERDDVAAFLDQLAQACGDEIARVVLYGSRARGDYDDESDVDLLIVTRDGREAVQTAARRLSRDRFWLVSSLVCSADEYRRMQRYQPPLYVELRRDGIELWDPDLALRERHDIPVDFPEGEPRAMNEETRDNVQSYFRRAQVTLVEAQGLLGLGLPNGAISRAYYAVFDSATAILYAYNVVRGKHTGIQSALNQFLVLPDILEEEYKDIYNDLFSGRLLSDYWKPEQGPPVEFTVEQARAFVADAARFVARIEELLRERGAFDAPPETNE